MTPRPTGTREPLSRPRVVAAGIALADALGVEAVSMRQVGRQLGVEAMSLYRYVSSKDVLLDAMVDAVIAEFPVADASLVWQDRLRTLVLGAYLVLLDHPWSTAAATSRPAVGPHRLRYSDDILGTLLDGGCGPQLAHDVSHAIDNHVFGFTLHELRLEAGSNGSDYATAAVPDGGAAAPTPNLSFVLQHAHHDRDAEYAFVLDVLIAGIERALATSADAGATSTGG
jgi:AcrR family transcriptional regulator